MKILLFPAFFLVVIFSGIQAQTPNSLPYEIKTDTALLKVLDTNYWEILEDPEGKLTIEQVSSAEYKNTFYPFNRKNAQAAIHYCWIRFTLKNSSASSASISLNCPSSKTDFYIFTDSTLRNPIHRVTGSFYSWKNKEGFKRVNAVPLEIPSGESMVVYCRRYKLDELLKNEYPEDFLRIYHTQLLESRELNLYENGYSPSEFNYSSFLSGFFFLAGILNLLIFIAARDKIYLYFSLFLLSISLWYNPVLNDLLGREYPLTADFLNRSGLSWLFFVLHFIRHYFRSFERFPRWDKFMVYYSLFFLLNILIPPFPMDFFYRTEVILFKALVMGLYLLFLGITLIKCLRLSGPARKPFVLAAAPFFIYVIGAILAYLFFVIFYDINQWTDKLNEILNYLLGLTIGWLVVLFSWYLYRRYAGQQKEITEVQLAKERIEREKEVERNELIAKQKEELEIQVAERTADLKQSLIELKSTQSQLIHSEKMASLGELTAGIAHEIQNPLNFVNNFAEINTELIDETAQAIDQHQPAEAKTLLTNIKENEIKILYHGKRADGIVKSMLQHSRTSTGIKEPTDINALCDEYLRLSYHGLRAKDKMFQSEYITDFDPNLPKVQVIQQEFGRVLLNLLNNAFYAVYKKSLGQKDSDAGAQVEKYKPLVTITTRKQKEKISITIADNGTGIPEHLLDKIFQPFFTTKPTGQGTGLGLSLAYDIVKAHGGEFTVSSIEGEGSEFKIVLPA